MKHRAWSDWERQEHVIDRVDGGGERGWTVCFDGGTCCGMPASDLITPKVGDTITLWGRGFGFSFRGQAINDVVVWYRDEIEDRQHHAEELRKREAEQRADYETKRAELDAVIAVLPEVFQRRIAGYLERNHDFGWKFLAYELSCCQDAVKIAAKCGDGDGVIAFQKLSWEQQKMAIPDLFDGHSGNSFGFACRMAFVYLTNPELVPKHYGALAVLIGSEEYGDWACSDEARQERLAAGN
jgi:hypothetical protein